MPNRQLPSGNLKEGLTRVRSRAAPTAKVDVPVRFASRVELERMAALHRRTSGPEPVTIGRGWLLPVVRAWRVAGLRGDASGSPAPTG